MVMTVITLNSTITIVIIVLKSQQMKPQLAELA